MTIARCRAEVCDYREEFAALDPAGREEMREMHWLGLADWAKEEILIMSERKELEQTSAICVNALTSICHEANISWWIDIDTGKPKQRNFGELIALCHSELSEALEGHRKNLPDDKLPHRPMAEVELADCLIRIFDLAGGMGYDLGGAFAEKMAYNATRADHKIENRRGENGKRY